MDWKGVGQIYTQISSITVRNTVRSSPTCTEISPCDNSSVTLPPEKMKITFNTHSLFIHVSVLFIRVLFLFIHAC